MTDFLKNALATAVPLKVLELQHRGGPTNADRAAAAVTVTTLNVKALAALGADADDQQRGRFARLVTALATLAFDAGGVTFLGQTYTAPPAEDA